MQGWADYQGAQLQEKREHEQTKASFATLHSAKYLPLKAERAELQERCQGLSIARREAAEAAERSGPGPRQPADPSKISASC